MSIYWMNKLNQLFFRLVYIKVEKKYITFLLFSTCVKKKMDIKNEKRKKLEGQEVKENIEWEKTIFNRLCRYMPIIYLWYSYSLFWRKGKYVSLGEWPSSSM